MIVLSLFAAILTACGVEKHQVSAVTSGEVQVRGGKIQEVSLSAEETLAMSNYMLGGRFLHSGKTLYGSRHDSEGDPYLCRMKFTAGEKGMYVREKEDIELKVDAQYLLLRDSWLYYLRKELPSGNVSILRMLSAEGSEAKPEILYDGSCDFLFGRGDRLYFTDASCHLLSMALDGTDLQTVVPDKAVYYPYLLTEDLLLFQDDADGESLHMRYLPTGFELRISRGRVFCYVVKGSVVWFVRSDEPDGEKCRLCRADLNEFLRTFDPTARPDASFVFTIEESDENMGPLFCINQDHINASNFQSADLSAWQSLSDDAWQTGFRFACEYVSPEFELFYEYNTEGLITGMFFYEPSLSRRGYIERYQYS